MGDGADWAGPFDADVVEIGREHAANDAREQRAEADMSTATITFGLYSIVRRIISSAALIPAMPKARLTAERISSQVDNEATSLTAVKRMPPCTRKLSMPARSATLSSRPSEAAGP